VGEVADLGQQLAFGLGHLHSLGIMCGGITTSGVFRGLRDGFWKLADFSRAAVLPVAASEWRERCRARPQESPPEARGCTDDAMKPEADVWLLAALLSALLCGAGTAVSGVPAVAPQRLTDPGVARLWLLLNWLLADGPECRPCAGEAAALLGAVLHTPPSELLDEMPVLERRRCRGVAIAAARQLAVDLVVSANVSNRFAWRYAEMSLECLRKEISDTSQIDLILENCGIEAGSTCLECDDAGEDAESEISGSAAASAAERALGAAAEQKVVGRHGGVQSDVSTNASSTSEESAGLGCGVNVAAFGFKSLSREPHADEKEVHLQEDFTDLLGLES